MSDGAVDEGMRVRLSWEKAAALASLGRLDAALDALLPGVDAASAARQDLIRAYCSLLRADPQGAETALVPALEVLDAAGDVASYLHGRRNLGAVRAAQDRHEEAIAILEDTWHRARAHGLTEEALSCLLNLGSITSGRPDLELRYSREAVTQSDRMRHSFHRVASRNNLAYTLVEDGQAELAVRVATRALMLAEEAQLSGVIGTILHTRGTAHLRLGDLRPPRRMRWLRSRWSSAHRSRTRCATCSRRSRTGDDLAPGDAGLRVVAGPLVHQDPVVVGLFVAPAPHDSKTDFDPDVTVIVAFL